MPKSLKSSEAEAASSDGEKPRDDPRHQGEQAHAGGREGATDPRRNRVVVDDELRVRDPDATEPVLAEVQVDVELLGPPARVRTEEALGHDASASATGMARSLARAAASSGTPSASISAGVIRRCRPKKVSGCGRRRIERKSISWMNSRVRPSDAARTASTTRRRPGT
jgi:hypothetical protein